MVLQELTVKVDIKISIIKAPGYFLGYYQGWQKKKKNTEQKQLTLEIMISQFYLTCDNTDITSTQLHIYNIHSVFFGEKIHHKIVVGIMDGNSLEMTINHNEGLRTQTWLEALWGQRILILWIMVPSTVPDLLLRISEYLKK